MRDCVVSGEVPHRSCVTRLRYELCTAENVQLFTFIDYQTIGSCLQSTKNFVDLGIRHVARVLGSDSLCHPWGLLVWSGLTTSACTIQLIPVSSCTGKQNNILPHHNSSDDPPNTKLWDFQTHTGYTTSLSSHSPFINNTSRSNRCRGYQAGQEEIIMGSGSHHSIEGAAHASPPMPSGQWRGFPEP